MNWKLQFKRLGGNLKINMEKDIKRKEVSNNKRILQYGLFMKNLLKVKILIQLL